MPRFKYIARLRSGEKVEGFLEANDKRSALLQIERQGQVPVLVAEAGAAQALEPAGGEKKRFRLELRRTHKPRMNMRETLFFSRELSDLLSSGMTLGNALHSLSKRKTRKAQDQIIIDLRDQIVQGASLSEALEKHGETFSTLYISMVRAGEASGQLSAVLERLCGHYERMQEAKEKVMMALIYPCIVLSMGIATMIFTMIFVVPRFAQVFKEMGNVLPLPTRILIGMSSFLLHYGWLLAIGIVVFVVLFRRWIRTAAGRRRWDLFKLRFPIVKNIITANAFVQFSRTLESLLTNGVPILQALTIVQDTVGNVVIADEIRAARERVTDGATISGPLSQGKVFPVLLTDMLAVGEESGNVAASLGHIGRRFESDLERSVKVLTTVLEPILILLMALMVGFVALSMLLAVFDLTSGLEV